MTGPAEPEGAGPESADAGQNAGRARPSARRARRSRRRSVTEIVVLILVAVLLAGLVRTFAAQAFYIPSSSMVPALDVHDRILVQKLFFSWHDVREGNIVVFRHPPRDHCPGPVEGDLVKRVIALPGQMIYSAGNSIYVDGKLLPQRFLPRSDPLGPPIPDASPQHPYRVPAGEFYMLGDNRDVSCDSRFWGPIKGSSMVGQVVLVWWHDGHPDFRRF